MNYSKQKNKEGGEKARYEELEKMAEETRQVVAEVQEARKQSRKAEWFAMTALAISVIRFILSLAEL